MDATRINIAISGLGLITTEDIKKRLRHIIPKDIKINWTNIADIELDFLFINHAFFDSNHIQKIVNENKIPYFKIAKHSDQIEQNDPHLLCTPITDESGLKHAIENYFIALTDSSIQSNTDSSDLQSISYQFFKQIYQEYSRKLLISDQHGSIALIDHHAHHAWPNKQHHSFDTNTSIRYADANTSDLLKISRKNQFNLENWLFELIWNSPVFVDLPNTSSHFKLSYWPQPVAKDSKIILQMSASFILGAEIAQVAQQFNIPLLTVQKFIIANQAINNADIIPAKEASFKARMHVLKNDVEAPVLKSFFNKLKRRFGF